MGVETAHVTDYFLGAARKIPGWLAEMLFLGDADGNRSGIESRLSSMGLSTGDTMQGLRCSLQQDPAGCLSEAGRGDGTSPARWVGGGGPQIRQQGREVLGKHAWQDPC